MSEKAKNLVFKAIAELNETLDDGIELVADPSTPLMNSDSAIDSLALVRLLVGIEQLAEDDLDLEITVVDESVFEGEETPFETVAGLIEHVAKLIA